MRPTIFLILTGIAALHWTHYCQSSPVVNDLVEKCMNAILGKANKEKRELENAEIQILHAFGFNKGEIDDKFGLFRLSPINNLDWVGKCLDAVLEKAYQEDRALADTEMQLLETLGFSEEVIKDKYGRYILTRSYDDESSSDDENEEGVARNVDDWSIIQQQPPGAILHPALEETVQMEDKEERKRKQKTEGDDYIPDDNDDDDDDYLPEDDDMSLLERTKKRRRSNRNRISDNNESKVSHDQGIHGANLPAVDSENEEAAAGTSGGSNIALPYPAAALPGAASDKPQPKRAPKRNSRGRNRNKAPVCRRKLRLNP